MMIKRVKIHKNKEDEKFLKEENRVELEEIQRQNQPWTSEFVKGQLCLQQKLQDRKFELRKEESKIVNDIDSKVCEIKMIKSKKIESEKQLKECEEGGGNDIQMDEISSQNVYTLNYFQYAKTLERSYGCEISKVDFGKFRKADIEGKGKGGVGFKFIGLSLPAHFWSKQKNICLVYTKRNMKQSYHTKLGNLHKYAMETGLTLVGKETEIDFLKKNSGEKLTKIRSEIKEIESDIRDNKKKIRRAVGEKGEQERIKKGRRMRKRKKPHNLFN